LACIHEMFYFFKSNSCRQIFVTFVSDMHRVQDTRLLLTLRKNWSATSFAKPHMQPAALHLRVLILPAVLTSWYSKFAHRYNTPELFLAVEYSCSMPVTYNWVLYKTTSAFIGKTRAIISIISVWFELLSVLFDFYSMVNITSKLATNNGRFLIPTQQWLSIKTRPVGLLCTNVLKHLRLIWCHVVRSRDFRDLLPHGRCFIAFSKAWRLFLSSS